MENNFIELAWAAGFLDGEGSFQVYHDKRWKNAKKRYRIEAVQVSREPLDRLQGALGGKVRGPYGPYSGNRQAYHQWIVEGDAAKAATQLVLPYLCSVKTGQATEALEVAS